jgi:hypothetical protein
MTANLPVSLWPAAAAFREEERSPMVALDDSSAGVWLDLMRFALGWGRSAAGCYRIPAGHIAALIGDFLCDRVTIEGAAGGAVPWFVVQAR